MPRFQIILPYACISTVQQGFVATQHGGYLLHSRQKGDSFVDKTFGERLHSYIVSILQILAAFYASVVFNGHVLMFWRSTEQT